MSYDHNHFCTQSVVNKVHPQSQVFSTASVATWREVNCAVHSPRLGSVLKQAQSCVLLVAITPQDIYRSMYSLTVTEVALI